MTSTWRNDTKIVEGAEFAIFDNTYWKGKDQLGPTVPDQLLNSIENIREYLNYPLRLIDNTLNTVIFSCMKTLTEYPNCDIKPPSSKTTNEKPLFDTNLLWLSETFQSTIDEGFRSKRKKYSFNKHRSNPFFKKRHHNNHLIELPPQCIVINGTKICIKKRDGIVLEGFSQDKKEKFTIQDLQHLIAEYQNNHDSFMIDTDIYYSTRNKVASYYIQKVNEYETKQKSFLDASGIFDFNNWFDNQLSDPNVQAAIQKQKFNYKDNKTFLYNSPPSLSNTVQSIINDLSRNKRDIFSRYYKDNENKFSNQLAIYCIQQKTKFENTQHPYEFLYDISFNSTDFNNNNRRFVIPFKKYFDNTWYYAYNIYSIFNNIKSEDLDTLLKSIVKIDPNPNLQQTFVKAVPSGSGSTNKPKDKCDNPDNNPCIKTQCNIDKELKKITQTVKKEVFNICFIPMILLIIYNVYYFLFYKDCYKQMDIDVKPVCTDYNEFPHLESWIKRDLLNIKVTDSPNFLVDFFLDLVFKPVTFFYTCFNSIKPFCMEKNKPFPYIGFIILSAIITPLFIVYKESIFEMIEKILFFEKPKPKMILFSTIIIWAWFALVALQRVAGIGLYQEPNPTDPSKSIPRSWWEWIKSNGANPFIAISSIIFTGLYWVFKGLATYSIIPLSVWPLFFYIFSVGLFGIWNNSSDGYNPKFESDRTKATEENPYKSSSSIWKDIDDSIYEKLFEKTGEENTLLENIKSAGKTILQFIIPFIGEIIAICILFSGMMTYATDKTLKGNPYHKLRNFLFISTGVLIIFIIGWCGLKYVTRIRKLRDFFNTNTSQKPDIDLADDRTFSNIWKEIFEISRDKTFAQLLKENIEKIPANAAKLGKYAVDKTKEGYNAAATKAAEVKDALKTSVDKSTSILPETGLPKV